MREDADRQLGEGAVRVGIGLASLPRPVSPGMYLKGSGWDLLTSWYLKARLGEVTDLEGALVGGSLGEEQLTPHREGRWWVGLQDTWLALPRDQASTMHLSGHQPDCGCP